MTHVVELSARAARDLAGAYPFIARDSPLNASRWAESMEAAVAGLARFPRRCPPARESEVAGADVRQLVHGGYRVLFVVTGRVVRVRHGRQGDASPWDLRGEWPQS